MRHEDIDDHQIEFGIVERRETVDPAVGDRDPESALLQPRPDREACVRVIIDHQYATHDGLLRRSTRSRDSKKGNSYRATTQWHRPRRQGAAVLPCESVH